MCGIAGVLAADPTVVESAVRRMMRHMVHRGPDDEGFAQFGPGRVDPPRTPTGRVGFGFRRLSILDLTNGGHQPMVNPETGDCLIFNGEVYNHGDLRQQLKSQGCVFRSSSDTEVFLWALSVWGEKALEHIDGMFGIAFYQARTGRVLLARDPLGIKPLYIGSGRATLAFASEVRPILATRLIDCQIDKVGISTFLAYGSPQDPLTVHTSIRSLLAGHFEWWRIDGNGPELESVRRYWTFPDSKSCSSRLSVGSIFEANVKQQLVADVPVGVFLSAGVDSAAVASAAVMTGTKITTISLGFSGDNSVDESSLAAKTAERLGTHHIQSIVDEPWLMLQWDEWLKTIDRPSVDGLNTHIISSVARDVGLKVCLSGLGADEIFGGYRSFDSLPRLQTLQQMIEWIPSSLRCSLAAALTIGCSSVHAEKAIEGAGLPADLLQLFLFQRRMVGTKSLCQLGLDHKLFGLDSDYMPAEAKKLANTGGDDLFNRISVAEIVFYMGNTLLRDADTNSMANSLELRVPFLGKTMLELVMSMPGRLKRGRDNRSKSLLREYVLNKLPEEISRRPKTGFNLPFGSWMHGTLAEQCEACVVRLAKSGLVDQHAVMNLWRYYCSRGTSIYYTRPLALVVLGSYLETVRPYCRTQA